MIYQTGGSISSKNQRKKTTDGQEATTGQTGQTEVERLACDIHARIEEMWG